MSQPAGRDCDHTHPRACADMTANVQHVHSVRAEMLRVAPRDPAARCDRPACAVPCQCRWCLRADGPCATSSSYQPDLPGAANIFVQRTFTSSASRGCICLSACATLAVVRACVPRSVIRMVGDGSPINEPYAGGGGGRGGYEVKRRVPADTSGSTRSTTV